MAFIHSDIKPMVGEIYGVFWNGTKYSCEAKLASNDYVVLGNGMVWGLPATSDPFCITFYNHEDENNVQVRSIDYLETVSLRVALPPMIDPKYIPDMYYKNWVKLMPETSISLQDPGDGSGMMTAVVPASGFVFVAEKTYTILYNGTSYDCKAVALNPEQIVVGNLGIFSGDFTDEPFVLGYTSFDEGASYAIMVIDLLGSESATLGIKEKNNKIVDYEFLPKIPVVDFTKYGLNFRRGNSITSDNPDLIKELAAAAGASDVIEILVDNYDISLGSTTKHTFYRGYYSPASGIYTYYSIGLYLYEINLQLREQTMRVSIKDLQTTG